MLARIVENWLTSAGETGYQSAFAQLLSAEGHRVLHAPVHHPFEHGKDIVTVAPGGALHAYQLKGGDISLGELEKIQGQLLALCGTSVSYPGVEPPRRPDRAFLVTSGRLSTPARDRVGAFNEGNRSYGMPPLEVIERDQLVGRFLAVHGSYLPAELSELNSLLAIILADGRGPFPTAGLAALLAVPLGRDESGPSPAVVTRAIASNVLLTAYTTGPWQQAENHLATAEAWLVAAFHTLWLAERFDLPEDYWELSFELAFSAARQELIRLLEDASGVEDLVIAHMAEGLVYSARAANVCGYLSALLLSESTLGNRPAVDERVHKVLVREEEYLRGYGEAAVASLLMTTIALEQLGEPLKSVTLAWKALHGLVRSNQPQSEEAIADPYHPVEDVLLSSLGGETTLDGESFSGEAYTAHVLLDWFARRDYQQVASRLWPDITRIHFCEYTPAASLDLLAHHSEDGVLRTWALPFPTSWAQLRQQAGTVSEGEMPRRLWQRLEALPYLPLLYPYRLTGAVGKALDYLAGQRCEVSFVD